MPLSAIDRDLIDRCLSQQPGAWIDFVDRYMGLIYHVVHHTAHARSVVLKPDDVEDIAAEIFLAIVENDYRVLRDFQGQAALPTYLTVIARRTAVRSLIKRHRESELGHVNASRAALSGEEAPDESEPVATAEEVDRMLRELPEREAEVVRLYHLKAQNYKQIGRQLGIPENSVGPILAQARRQLRQIAEQRNGV